MINQNLYQYCLQLGDNALILSHRLSEWTSNGPFLEEDLALTNIALDILGRANSLLQYAAKLENKGRTEDDLAYKRNERQFFNLLICELPNGDYAKTMMRQYLYSAWELELFKYLSQSKDQIIAGIAAKSVKEVTYHLRHCKMWVERFANGTDESKLKLKNAFTLLWPYIGEFFENNETQQKLISENIIIEMPHLKLNWDNEVLPFINNCGLQIPETVYMQTGSKKGLHSEHLGFILAEMQSLNRMHPNAKW